ncbi:MarR family transcriptional regulator [Citricoccus alkalitolerans]|uniref:MarR family transcriptional regulator n=1 Tax=Citricoccus alkalitolerans TaxID=246603 RepID=A0ABV8Y5E1_9MICC
MCRTLCLDFDAKPATGGEPAVLSDVHTTTGLLHAAGASWIRDRSPSGGRHVYVPLREPVPFHVARELVEALAIACPTLDPSPHRSIISGCIRTPGSVHRAGGHQQLEMGLEDAVAVATHRNGQDAFDRLWEELSEYRAMVRAHRYDEAEPDGVVSADASGPVAVSGRTMSTEMLRTATDGTWNHTRYASASEARQAVLVNAAGSGLGLVDIQARILNGVWPGLAQFYSRYSPTHRQAALRRDWVEAQRFATQSPVRKSNTSQPSTQGGPSVSASQQVRTWLNALKVVDTRLGSDRNSLTKRLLLRAVAEACMKTGDVVVAFGVRALAVAIGSDASTVSRHLRELVQDPEPLLALIQKGHGTEADTYRLVVPDHLEQAAAARSWRPGKIHALRPVFRSLGMPEALVFEALEMLGTSVPVKTLVQESGLSRTAVNDALNVLASWRLCTGSAGLWSLSPTASDANLEALAEQLGVLEQVFQQVARYRAERAVWHSWLAARAAAQSAGYIDDLAHASLLWELVEPPPDPWESTLVPG